MNDRLTSWIRIIILSHPVKPILSLPHQFMESYKSLVSIKRVWKIICLPTAPLLLADDISYQCAHLK